MIDEKRLQLLIDKSDIHDMMCRYARGVDRMDKDLVLTCFWPEATCVYPSSLTTVFKGRFIDFLEASWESWKVYTAQQHHLCNHLCEVDGDQALAETYQFSFYWAEPGDDPTLNLLNSNRYIDRYERRNGEWRVIHRELIRNFSFSIAPQGFASVENGWPRLSQSRDDPGYRTLKSEARSS
uniref:SnoaL-like domain-containing protein n=1 Tax=Caulobacter sp. (strain K31) TaxID=366602 RepID=B0T6L6_CAUSK